MGKISAHDLMDGMVAVCAVLGWLSAWLERRDSRKREQERSDEMRGVKGFKFRMMYRAMAAERGWPMNGEDED